MTVPLIRDRAANEWTQGELVHAEDARAGVGGPVGPGGGVRRTNEPAATPGLGRCYSCYLLGLGRCYLREGFYGEAGLIGRLREGCPG